MHKALFLDRDGVINIDYGYVHKIADFKPVPGIFELCQAALDKDYKLVVITNQSGIARGMYTEDDVRNLHNYMEALFASRNVYFDNIFYCPHHPEFSGKCFCRKPSSLLFERATALVNITPSESWTVGDKERDLQAGKNIGTRGAYIGEKTVKIADFSSTELKSLISLL